MTNDYTLPAVLYYDDDCSFCTAIVRWLARLDWRRTLEFRSGFDDTARMAGLTPEDLRRSAYLVTPQGRAYEGFYAFRQIALRLPLLWLVAPLAWLRGMPYLGVRLYRWVAEHRHVISRCGWPRPASPH